MANSSHTHAQPLKKNTVSQHSQHVSSFRINEQYVVTCNDATRLLIINNQVVKCSPIEYQISVALLRHSFRSLSQLRTELFGQQEHDLTGFRTQLRKSISRLRPKLWVLGLDISCLYSQGYLLVDGHTMLPLLMGHEPTNVLPSSTPRLKGRGLVPRPEGEYERASPHFSSPMSKDTPARGKTGDTKREQSQRMRIFLHGTVTVTRVLACELKKHYSHLGELTDAEAQHVLITGKVTYGEQ